MKINKFTNLFFISLFLIVFFILSFYIFVFPNNNFANITEDLIARESWRKISLDLEGARLIDVLKVLSQQSGLNFIAAQNVSDRPITLYMESVPMREALDKILKSNNLTYDLDETSNIFVVKELIRPSEVDTTTRIYTLKYARVNSSPLNKVSVNSTSGNSIVDAVRALLTNYGKLNEDSRTNSLIITDLSSQFSLIEDMIKGLDIPIPQVIIEAEVIDTTKYLVDTMGMRWGNPIYNLTLASRTGLAFPFQRYGPRDENLGVTTGSISTPSGSVSAALYALKENTDTKTLARPKILTLSNETAEIKITGDEATGNTVARYDENGNLVSSEPERFEVGVILKVTPSVNMATGEITMVLEPTVSSVIQSSSTEQYDPQKREAKVTISVKDGETVVLGGLLKKDISNDGNKIPVLGDIPFLGALFRDKTKSDKDRELLVFITPRIVNGSDVNLARSEQKYDSDILAEREQTGYQYRREEIDKVLSVWDNK